MKAILVIDEMPKTCEECEYGQWYGSACRLLDCDTYRDETGRHEDCPLKPIPNEACQILVEGLDAMEKMESIEVRVVRRTE